MMQNHTPSGPRLTSRWTGRFQPSIGVHTVAIGERLALFSEDRQEMVELNHTAALLWRGVELKYSLRRLVGLLTARGAAPDDARLHVQAALLEWLKQGWALPVGLLDGGDRSTPPSLSLIVLGVGFVVEWHGATPSAALWLMLEPLRGSPANYHLLSVLPWADGYILLVGRCCHGFFAEDELVPAVKAALSDVLARSVREGFLAHGALMALDGRRLFISGPPGAGKSTLAISLLAADFICLSDDIVLVDPTGRMEGAGFSPCLKSGAWPLLPHWAKVLDAAGAHRRADGQIVRYAPTAVTKVGAGAMEFFIALDRCDAGAAELEPLDGLDAICSLLEGAFSASRAISSSQIAALSQTFAAAKCYRLVYSSLPEAVDRLHGLFHA
jgi:hypothetical protein